MQAAINAAYQKFQHLQEGKNADYIPALAKVDPNLFGIAVVTPDGKVFTAGDMKTEVSIQSISKVFTMARVIQDSGPDAIENTIGVDATGLKFNSIVVRGAVEEAWRRSGNERAGQPGRDYRDQHGAGPDAPTPSGRRSSARTTTSPAAS